MAPLEFLHFLYFSADGMSACRPEAGARSCRRDGGAHLTAHGAPTQLSVGITNSYSYRRAIVGSIFIALCVGIEAAINAVSNRSVTVSK